MRKEIQHQISLTQKKKRQSNVKKTMNLKLSSISDNRMKNRIAKARWRSKRNTNQISSDRERNKMLQFKLREQKTPEQRKMGTEADTFSKQNRRSKRTEFQVKADKVANTKIQREIRSKRSPDKRKAATSSDTFLKQNKRSKRAEDQVLADRIHDKTRKTKKRQQHHHVFSNILKEFQKAIQEGPTYTCTCCHRLLYRQSIQRVISGNYTKCTKEILLQCLTGEDMICKTCHRALLQGNIPAMASCNKLQVRPIPSELECLSELEARLIAKRIPFMKLMNLPSGKQKAVVGSVVNVPVDIVQTCASLPRSSTSDMGFIPLKLKRKIQYTGHVQYQMIRPSAVEKGLCYLQQNHKLYRDIDMNVLWQQEFENDNEQLWQALTVAEHNTQETVENLETESDHESTKDNEQPTTYITTDKRQHASQAILEDEQQPTEILQDHDNNKVSNHLIEKEKIWRIS